MFRVNLTGTETKDLKNWSGQDGLHHSAEEKIRIVIAGLRGGESIAALCRSEGIAESLYGVLHFGGPTSMLGSGFLNLPLSLDHRV